MTLSDSSGYIYDEKGIDEAKLNYVLYLKNVKRSRIKDYVEKYPEAVYTAADPSTGFNPLWDHKADCAFPSATQNEINERDAKNLVGNGIQVVSEGANMPTTPDGVNIFLEHRILYGPGKAANAGGVAVSGLEMTQNAGCMRRSRTDVDGQLQTIMRSIHANCLRYGKEGDYCNYVQGANVAGFVKVAKAMVAQGVV